MGFNKRSKTEFITDFQNSNFYDSNTPNKINKITKINKTKKNYNPEVAPEIIKEKIINNKVNTKADIKLNNKNKINLKEKIIENKLLIPEVITQNKKEEKVIEKVIEKKLPKLENIEQDNSQKLDNSQELYIGVVNQISDPQTFFENFSVEAQEIAEIILENWCSAKGMPVDFYSDLIFEINNLGKVTNIKINAGNKSLIYQAHVKNSLSKCIFPKKYFKKICRVILKA